MQWGLPTDGPCDQFLPYGDQFQSFSTTPARYTSNFSPPWCASCQNVITRTTWLVWGHFTLLVLWQMLTKQGGRHIPKTVQGR